MKILVTGTAGFIGSHVAMRLLDTEADVSALIAAVDYRPTVSVEQGVSQFVQCYQSYYA